jgi:hypothetical protein
MVTKFSSIEGQFLWSDPGDIDGLVAPSPRGAGFIWGPKLTKAFLGQNKLKFLIRSHQVVMQGLSSIHMHLYCYFGVPNTDMLLKVSSISTMT